jgi:hypothetical protein
MIIFIVVAIAFITVVAFYVTARGRRQASVRQVLPVDLKAFSTLTDRADEVFLKEKLPARRFRQLKRQRIKVTWSYIRRIGGNAAAILRLSEAARLSPDPEIARSASQVAEIAAGLRIQCMLAALKLAVEFAIPSVQLTPALLDQQYHLLRENLMQLGGLQAAGSAPLPLAI